MRFAALALAVASLVVVTAVRLADPGGDVPPPTPDETASALFEPSGDLPPGDIPSLVRIFDPLLRPLGMRLTRGGLADGPGTTENPELAGRHLAVYVEPLSSSHSPDEYLGTLIESARVFLPSVFDRWSGLASMDVCQEPPPGVDDRFAPPPVTVVEVTRAQADVIVWPTVDLATLLAASDADLVSLHLDTPLEQTEAHRRARDLASRVGSLTG